MDYKMPFRMNDYLRSRDLFLRREEAADQETKADKEAVITAAKLKEYIRAKQDAEDSAKEELISAKSKTEIDEKSAGKSEGKKESTEDKTDIDLKTVRELLNTLIKQIENIQAAAKALPLSSNPVSYPSSPAPPAVSSSKKDHREEMESHIEADHVPKRAKYSGYEVKKRPINKKVKPNQRTVYIKPHDVMRMLTGSQDLPSDFMPDVVPIQRRTRGPYMTSSSGPRGMRSLPLFPPSYGGGYSGYPGIIGIPFPVQKPCPSCRSSLTDDDDDDFASTGGYKK